MAMVSLNAAFCTPHLDDDDDDNDDEYERKKKRVESFLRRSDLPEVERMESWSTSQSGTY